MMKKLLAIILSAVMLLSLAACAEETEPGEKLPVISGEEDKVPSTTPNEGKTEDTTDNSVDCASTFVEITDYNLYATQIYDYSLTDEYSEGLLFNTEIIKSKENLTAAAQAVSVDADAKEFKKYDAAFFEEKQLVALTVFFTKTDGVEMAVGGVYPETTENETEDYRVQFVFYTNNGPDGASSDQMCHYFRFVLIELDKNLNLSTDNIKLSW